MNLFHKRLNSKQWTNMRLRLHEIDFVDKMWCTHVLILIARNGLALQQDEHSGEFMCHNELIRIFQTAVAGRLFRNNDENSRKKE